MQQNPCTSKWCKSVRILLGDHSDTCCSLFTLLETIWFSRWRKRNALGTFWPVSSHIPNTWRCLHHSIIDQMMLLADLMLACLGWWHARDSLASCSKYRASTHPTSFPSLFNNTTIMSQSQHCSLARLNSLSSRTSQDVFRSLHYSPSAGVLGS